MTQVKVGKASKAVAQLAVAGLMVAAAGVGVSQTVSAAATLLASTGPLACSQTALILGGTGQP
ncbi:MAG: hypothetical protein WA942_17145, partial [Mycolicibacter sinensis]